MLKRRADVEPGARESASQRISQRLLENPWILSASSIALYWSTPHEVATQAIFSSLQKLGKKLALPRVDGDELRFFEVGDSSYLEPGSLGIAEPSAQASETPLDKIDLMIVPGVAFDRVGNRLGRGQGYYDRSLQDFIGHTMGLAFQFQILDRLPVESFDQRVQQILTEDETIDCSLLEDRLKERGL